jgi:RHS repeat-associated protein
VTNGQNTGSFEQATLPFGNALDVESTGATNRRFTSYDRSSTTNLDYAVNRHYDAFQGRFTQIDPIGMKSASLSSPQTLNLYAYCDNDPINQTDPTGLGFFSFMKNLFKGIAKVLTNKWVIIALAVALAVITIGSAAFGWTLLKTVYASLGPSGFGTEIMIPVGTKATTLGWIASALKMSLAVTSIGFSGKVMLQNILNSTAGIGISRVMSLLPPDPIGSGRTPPFGFVSGKPLTQQQADLVWNALEVVRKALEKPLCRKYVGERGYQMLRKIWDEKRMTYWNGVSVDERGPNWAATRTYWLQTPSMILTYNFFYNDQVYQEASRYGISSLERRAATLMHEVRHALGKGYIEEHDRWTPDIVKYCFK